MCSSERVTHMSKTTGCVVEVLVMVMCDLARARALIAAFEVVSNGSR